jgi:hypothetical protein
MSSLVQNKININKIIEHKIFHILTSIQIETHKKILLISNKTLTENRVNIYKMQLLNINNAKIIFNILIL